MAGDRILGTAGHIDHGKTALVRALTGIDTDRLPEEKARGISIDLGFAALVGTDGLTLGVVDVPGHEVFVRTMVAGATGFDLVLLCVAADEGVMPQTREHLAVLNLLGVPRLVVAITRCDLAEEGMADLVEEEVIEWLAPGRYAGAAIHRVSAVTGEGVEALRTRLLQTAAGFDGAPRADDLTFLPVDRVFTAHGTGTVVTGTLRSGRLKRGDEVDLHPGGVRLRVRGLQRHGREVERVEAGSRTAVALVGKGENVPSIRRGSVLTSGPGWRETNRILAELTPLPGAEDALEPGAQVRVHLGTGEIIGRIRRVRGSDARNIDLDAPVVPRGGERFVIRGLTPVETIGGGVVLHPFPPTRVRAEEAEGLRSAFAAESARERIALGVRSAGWRGVPISDLSVRFGVAAPDPAEMEAPTGATRVGRLLVETARIDALIREICHAVDLFHDATPEEDGIQPARLPPGTAWAAAPEEIRSAVLKALVQNGELAWSEGRLRRPGHRPRIPEPLLPLADAVRAALHRAGVEGLDSPELHAAVGTESAPLLSVLHFLEREGEVLALEPERWIDAGRMAEAKRRMEGAHPPGEPFSLADARDCLGLSRRLLLPLMERWDRDGFTERIGDRRVVRVESRGEGTSDSP